METIIFDDLLQEKLKDPEFKAGFERENAKLESAISLTNARVEAGLTQRELAALAHVPQSTIARIERGDNTSIDTLSKLAQAMGKNVTVTIH